MNDTLKTIASRFSCRAFTDQAPTDEQLDAVAMAALAAPSAMNRQPWRVVVVKDKALLDEMDAEGIRIISEYDDKSMYERMRSRGGKMFYNAPSMVLVLSDGSDYAALDCGILTQNVALAAESLGLASVICGMARLAFQGGKAAYFTEKLRIPEGFTFGMSVLIGHAAAPGAPHLPDKSKLSVIC
ncbi:MAG: nitroreductase family protein [Oscillospiraceae bacterium]|nr:nitroreductase family protein [Oscillospiraceae bacterium]